MKMRKNAICILCSTWLATVYGMPVSMAATAILDKTIQTVRQDYQRFYSWSNLVDFGAGLGVAGVMANTSVDEEIQEWYQGDIRDTVSDNVSSNIKWTGNYKVTVPIFLGAALLGEVGGSSALISIPGKWGRTSLRALLVGEPVLLGFQRGLGASRPVEGGSEWDPFNDDNGVSGHGFVGAIPFLTAAKMSDNRLLKGLFYIGSALPAWSRVNDNQHYPSQALLGWWLAYLSVESTENTEQRALRIAPLFLKNGGGIRLSYQH
jgi:membrane-associated phospholipid phosphatase